MTAVEIYAAVGWFALVVMVAMFFRVGEQRTRMTSTVFLVAALTVASAAILRFAEAV